MTEDIIIPVKLLEERLFEAELMAAESHKEAMNSYGAGYDAGYVMALRSIKAGGFS